MDFTKKIFKNDPPNILDWSKNDESLWKGVQQNSLNSVRSLLRKGVDPTKRHKSGSNSFCLAILKRNPAMISAFMTEAPPFDVNAPDDNGRTAMHLIISTGQFDVAEKLIKEKNVNLLVEDNEKRTLMHFAVLHGSINCVDLLVKNGAPNDWPDKYGFTALHYAAKNNQATLCKLLVENGASVNRQDARGWTPLFFSSQNGNSSLTKLLFDLGADKNVKDSQGYTAFFYSKQPRETSFSKLFENQEDIEGAELDQTDTTESAKKGSKRDSLNHFDNIKRSIQDCETSIDQNDVVGAKSNLEDIHDQVELLESSLQHISLNDEQLRENAFNRRYANSYRKLKNQVEFNDSTDLVVCISDTLTQVQTLVNENEELRKKISVLEAEIREVDSIKTKSENETYADLLARNSILMEENEHIKKLFSQHQLDLSLVEKVKKNFYHYELKPENVELVENGKKENLELKALKNQVESYIELENKYKNSLATIETLKNNSDSNFPDVSSDKDWKRHVESYSNNVLNDYKKLLISLGRSKTETINSNESFYSYKTSFPILRTPSDPSFSSENFRKSNEVAKSPNPSQYGSSGSDLVYYEALQEQTINDKSALSQKKSFENESKRLSQLDKCEANSLANSLENLKRKKGENENLNFEIESLKKQLLAYETEQQGLDKLRETIIQEFSLGPLKRSQVTSADLDDILKKRLKDMKNREKKDKEKIEKNEEEIYYLHKSLQNYKNIGDQNEKLKIKIKHYEELFKNNFEKKENLRKKNDIESDKFINEFLSENLHLFNDDKTKKALEDCFDYIIKLKCEIENLEKENRKLLDLNESSLKQVKKFEEKPFILHATNDGPKTPIIVLTQEKSLLSSDSNEELKLGDLVARKNIIEKEIENLNSICLHNFDEKNSKKQELFEQLNEINSEIEEKYGMLDISPLKEDLVENSFIKFESSTPDLPHNSFKVIESAEMKTDIEFVDSLKEPLPPALPSSLPPDLPSSLSFYQPLSSTFISTISSVPSNSLSFSPSKVTPTSSITYYLTYPNTSPSIYTSLPTNSTPNSLPISINSSITSTPQTLNENTSLSYKHVENFNMYLTNQINYLKPLTTNVTIGIHEINSTPVKTSFSTFYTKNFSDKKTKYSIKKQTFGNSKDELLNENEKLQQDLIKEHEKIKYLLSNVHKQNYQDASNAGYAEFVQNVEDISDKQKKVIDDEEKNIEKLNAASEVKNKYSKHTKSDSEIDGAYQTTKNNYDELKLGYIRDSDGGKTYDLKKEVERLKKANLYVESENDILIKRIDGLKKEMNLVDSEKVKLIEEFTEEINKLKSENKKLLKELNDKISSDSLDNKKLNETLRREYFANNSSKPQFDLNKTDIDIENMNLKDKLEELNKKIEKLILDKNKLNEELNKKNYKKNEENHIDRVNETFEKETLTRRISSSDVKTELKPAECQTDAIMNREQYFVDALDFEDEINKTLFLKLKYMDLGEKEILLDILNKDGINIKEIEKLHDLLGSTTNELETYKRMFEEAKNDSKNNGTFYNEVEIFDLREENKHLKKELYRLKHTMNKSGLNRDTIELQNVAHLKRQNYLCEEKLEEKEQEHDLLKLKLSSLESENENLESQLAIYRHTKKSLPSNDSSDLTRQLRNENKKLRDFLIILQQTTQPCKHNSIGQTVSSKDEERNKDSFSDPKSEK